jgi:hypothetical protein
MGIEYTFDKHNKITLSENIFNAKMRGDSKTYIENGLNYDTVISSLVRTNK